jgi:hypothetical protein
MVSKSSTTSSTVSTPRQSVARDLRAATNKFASPATTFARPAVRDEPTPAPVGNWQGFSTLHSRPAVTSPPPTTPFTAPAAPANTPAPAQATVAAKPFATPTVSTTSAAPAALEKKEAATNLLGRQMADIKSTSTGKSSHADKSEMLSSNTNTSQVAMSSRPIFARKLLRQARRRSPLYLRLP